MLLLLVVYAEVLCGFVARFRGRISLPLGRWGFLGMLAHHFLVESFEVFGGNQGRERSDVWIYAFLVFPVLTFLGARRKLALDYRVRGEILVSLHRLEPGFGVDVLCGYLLLLHLQFRRLKQNVLPLTDVAVRILPFSH